LRFHVVAAVVVDVHEMLAKDDEEKPIRRLLIRHETGTLGRRVARIPRC
jgi:hypothetical protein